MFVVLSVSLLLSAYIITYCGHQPISAYFNVNNTDYNKYNNIWTTILHTVGYYMCFDD